MEPELHLAGVFDVRYRRQRDVAADPTAVGRRGEHRDRSGGWRSLRGRGAGRHGARVAAVRRDVGPVGPAAGEHPVLDPGPVPAAGGGAVEMVPVVEGHVVAVDFLVIRDVDLRQQEVARGPCGHRRSGHRADGDYAFGGRCWDHPVRQRLRAAVYGSVQIGESGSPPELVLMAEVRLIGDLVGVQLIVAIEVESRLHQVAAVGAVGGTGGHREEGEQVVHSGAVHHCVAEVLGPQHLVAVEVLVEVAVPAALEGTAVIAVAG